MLLLPKRLGDNCTLAPIFFLILILFSFFIFFILHLYCKMIDYLSERSRGNEVTRSRRDFLRAVPSTSRHRPPRFIS